MVTVTQKGMINTILLIGIGVVLLASLLLILTIYTITFIVNIILNQIQ
jgi:hypothetical protein